jgi:3-hydroxyacyl-CoA dehydrogenase
VLKDIDDALVQAGLEEARNVTQGQVGKLAEKGKITAEQAEAQIEEIVGRIHGTTSYEGFGDVDFVVEAVPEKIEIKQTVLAELDAATPGHAILASNTSSLSITEMGEVTGRPDQVVGFHFFYPASVMRLVEVVEGEDTSEETAQAAAGFAQAIRKLPIRCGEAPGFVVNRILNSAASELWRFQEETDTDVKQIDQIVADSKAAPMGPFFLADLLGLDTVLHVAEHLNASYGSRFYIHQGMRRLVGAGTLGAKTKKGFYEHGD